MTGPWRPSLADPATVDRAICAHAADLAITALNGPRSVVISGCIRRVGGGRGRVDGGRRADRAAGRVARFPLPLI